MNVRFAELPHCGFGAAASLALLLALVLLRQDAERIVFAQGTRLVAAYGFDEATGNTVVDASGSANTGTITTAVRTSAVKYGGAL